MGTDLCLREAGGGGKAVEPGRTGIRTGSQGRQRGSGETGMLERGVGRGTGTWDHFAFFVAVFSFRVRNRVV